MKRITAVFLAGLLCFSVYGQVDTSKSKFWMMTYFINGSDYVGARLAFSSDSTGMRWQKYNNEAAVLVPVLLPGANDNRMRDPMIAFDSVNQRFNLIWTVSWTGRVIGWDTSSRLKAGTWGPQVGLAVGASITNCAFSWAPEIYWDDINRNWMIYWSVSISATNTRIMYSTITGTDFTTFSAPQVLYNPGYDIIDANIFKNAQGSYYMFFKDERTGTDNKDIHYVTATSPRGPWGSLHTKVVNTGTEGPSMVKQGNEYHLFFDPYSTTTTYRMVKATDINTTASPWTDAGALQHWNGTSNVNFTYSHSNVIAIPKKYVLWMLHNIPLPTSAVQPDYKVKPAGRFPVFEGQSTDFIKIFDLSGRMVAMERVLGGYGVQSKSFIGRLPAGFYIESAGNRQSAGIKAESKK